MKFYIIEDDMSVIKMLENIIEDNDLGIMSGYSLDSEESISDILSLNPDIVLIDLLMPKKDGIEIVKELKVKDCISCFIMISQVSAKNMISKAYSAGIDFFINKPINIIEVTSVIRTVSQKINYLNTLQNIKSMFISSENSKKDDDIPIDKIRKIKYLLNKLGMSGEKGSKDILNICNYLIDSNQNFSDCNIKEICKKLDPNSAAMEQRIRRAIGKGLTNLANIGIEDYMNETFVSYSSALFSFEDVKSQMDFIRGKKKYGGKINMKKFVEGLVIMTEE